MNTERIELAKERFLIMYPGGFDNPAMEEIRKKHKPEKMYQMARDIFHKDNFGKGDIFSENITKFISRASVVSVFEKTRFRDFTKNCRGEEKEMLSAVFFELIHGDKAMAFTLFNELLGPYKLNKWTILTSCLSYYYPENEVFIKPTTVKTAIKYFQMENVKYSPRPELDFYNSYRAQFLELKNITGLTTDNLALGGFIMIAAEKE